MPTIMVMVLIILSFMVIGISPLGDGKQPLFLISSIIFGIFLSLILLTASISLPIEFRTYQAKSQNVDGVDIVFLNGDKINLNKTMGCDVEEGTVIYRSFQKPIFGFVFREWYPYQQYLMEENNVK